MKRFNHGSYRALAWFCGRETLVAKDEPGGLDPTQSPGHRHRPLYPRSPRILQLWRIHKILTSPQCGQLERGGLTQKYLLSLYKNILLSWAKNILLCWSKNILSSWDQKYICLWTFVSCPASQRGNRRSRKGWGASGGHQVRRYFIKKYFFGGQIFSKKNIS